MSVWPPPRKVVQPCSVLRTTQPGTLSPPLQAVPVPRPAAPPVYRPNHSLPPQASPIQNAPIQRKAAPPAHCTPAPIQRMPAPPPVYRPNNALPPQVSPIQNRLIQRMATPPAYRAAVPIQRTSAPPPVYRPNQAVPVQRASVNLQLRPTAVIQRHKPKNILSEKRLGDKPVQRVADKIAQLFHQPFRVVGIKEHTDSDFAVSSMVQIAKEGSIIDPLLKPVKVSKKDGTAAFEDAALGINGLTVENKDAKLIHLRQNQNMDATFVHESLHAYSHDDFRRFFGTEADEGTTELFARRVMQAIDLENSGISGYQPMAATRGKVYTHEVSLAETILAQLGETMTKNAYFNGDTLAVVNWINGSNDAARKPLRDAWRDAHLGTPPALPPFFAQL